MRAFPVLAPDAPVGVILDPSWHLPRSASDPDPTRRTTWTVVQKLRLTGYLYVVDSGDIDGWIVIDGQFAGIAGTEWGGPHLLLDNPGAPACAAHVRAASLGDAVSYYRSNPRPAQEVS